MRGRGRSGLVLVGLLTSAAVQLAVPALAAQPPPVLEAVLDGRAVDSIDANDPARLEPEKGTVLGVTVTNRGDTPLEVRSVRLDARVLGLAFFTYTTRVDLLVPPGETGTRTFALDLADLGDQATGLLPARVALLDAEREVVAEQRLAVDVRGGATAVYAVFGLGTGLITALLIAGLVARLVSNRLPVNRWSRAWRFLLPGIGVGLTLTFTLSVLRVAVPSPGLSRVLVLAGAVVGLVVGYLSPTPDDGTGRDDLDEQDLVDDDADDGLRVIDLRDPVPPPGQAPPTLVPGQRPQDLPVRPSEPAS